MSTTMDSYAAAHRGGITDAERRRLDLQAEMYGRLSTWTLDALGLGTGQRVADVGWDRSTPAPDGRARRPDRPRDRRRS